MNQTIPQAMNQTTGHTTAHKMAWLMIQGLRCARVVLDIIAIVSTIIVAYSLKFKISWAAQHYLGVSLGDVITHGNVESYTHVMWIIVVIWLVSFYFAGLYHRTHTFMPEIEEIIKVIKGVSIATVIMMSVTFLVDEFPDSRYVVAYSWIIGIIIMSLSRLLLLKYQLWLFKKGIGSKNTLVIGGDDVGQDIVEKIYHMPTLGFRYSGSVSDAQPEKLYFTIKNTFKHLGKFSDIIRIMQAHKIEMVFITQEARELPKFKEFVLYCDNHGIRYDYLTHILSEFSPSVMMTDFDGYPFITNRQTSDQDRAIGLMIKHGLDKIMALIGLIVLSPLLIGIGLFIKCVSPKGPIVFSQERVGKGNVPFNMFKFRTMKPDAEAKTGPVFVDEGNETRYIKGGDFLRKTSLDELPQLWNILKGDMSLIGPRPERPFFVDQFSQDIPYFNRRHAMRGGITGWAQINGRSVLTRRPDQKLKYDIYYINNWSLVLDFKIILKTIMVVLTKEEAY